MKRIMLVSILVIAIVLIVGFSLGLISTCETIIFPKAIENNLRSKSCTCKGLELPIYNYLATDGGKLSICIGSANQKTTLNNEISNNFSIELSIEGGRTAFKKLTTSIYSNGLISIKTTNRDGKTILKESKLADESKENYVKLINEFINSDFQEAYSCLPSVNSEKPECLWLDMPTKTLIVTQNGYTKKVVIDGVPELPLPLKNLLDAINNTTIIVES